MSGPWEKYAAQPSANEGPWNQYNPTANKEEEPGFLRQIDNFVRTAANGATFGYADKLAAAMGGGKYDDNIKNERAASKKAERDLGMASLPAELAGGVAGALATGGGSLVARGASLGGKVGYGALEGAGYGALNAAGHTDDGNYMKSVPEGAAVGAALGGAIPVAMKGAKAAISPLADKMASLTEGQLANRALAEKLGIPLTAGMETGSDNLRRAESVASQIPLGNLFGGGMDGAMDKFREAVAKRFGLAGSDLSPQVLQRSRDAMGKEYDVISQRNTLNDQNALWLNDLLGMRQRIAQDMEQAPGDTLIRRIDNLYNQFVNEHGGQMPGEVYQKLRAGLRKDADLLKGTSPQSAQYLKEIKKSLDDMMGRSVSKADEAAWKNLNDRYSHYKTVERAMGTAGSAGSGNLSPLKFAQTVRAQNGPDQFSRGQGTYGDLALLADDLFRGVPDSGTAGRNFMTKIMEGGGLGGLGTAGGGAAGLYLGGLSGAAAGVGIPIGAANALNSKPVQAYLKNQFLTVQREEALRDLLQKYGPSGLLAVGY
jgi:hypothetical protein